jgi:hypothetical protein
MPTNRCTATITVQKTIDGFKHVEKLQCHRPAKHVEDQDDPLERIHVFFGRIIWEMEHGGTFCIADHSPYVYDEGGDA